MRILIFAAGATVLLLCQAAAARCFEVPSVLSEVRIDSCQVAIFKTSFEAVGRTDTYETDSIAEGIVINVRIEKSWLAWQRESAVRKLWPDIDPKPNRKNSFEAFYVHGESAMTCKQIVGKQVTIATADHCCDVVPRTDSCAVRVKKVVLLKSTIGYLPLAESK